MLRRQIKRTLKISINGRNSCPGTFQVLIPSSDGSISVFPSSDINEEYENADGSCEFEEEIQSPEFKLFSDGQVVGFIWREEGTYTYVESTIQDNSLVFDVDCPYRVQVYGSTFKCVTEEPDGYYKADVSSDEPTADLRYLVCDFPYPIVGEDGVCRQRCPGNDLLVFRDQRFRCISSCADLDKKDNKKHYAIGSMEKGGAGLQYVTCVVCHALLEMRNGREWCVQTCRPSDRALE